MADDMDLDRDESEVATFASAEFRPHADRVLLQVDPWNEVLPSGLTVVHNHERPDMLKATVLRAGPGKRVKGALIPTEVVEGDRVLINRRWAGVELRGPLNEEWIVVRNEQIEAVCV